jgi:hypothetical protein
MAYGLIPPYTLSFCAGRSYNRHIEIDASGTKGSVHPGMNLVQNSNDLCQIETVRLWFKVFIPADIDGAELVPAGQHKGKTMLHSPNPVALWFLTDGRDFDSNPQAQARMHSEIVLDVKRFQVLQESHHCGATIQVNPETGEEECRETADTDEMHFEDFNLLPEMRIMRMRLRGSSKNACLKLASIKVSPNVDYEGEINLRLHENKRELTLSFQGQIETYPAFEMYMTINDGAAIPIFQLPVEPEASPLSLIGPPKRPVKVSVTVGCKPRA